LTFHTIIEIIDKTAEFVSKHGPAFEAQLHNEEIQKNKNPKFTFLLPTDALHPYFRYKVAELKPIPPAGTPMELQSTNQQPVTTRVVEEKPQKRTLQYLVSKSRLDVEPKETPPPLFAIDVPTILTAVDLDIMKLAAQFVARNGKSFHAGLITREHKNPQFDFLQPQSPFNPIFNSLVESYTKCMLPPRGIVETLEGEQDKRQILDRILQHAEWEKVQNRSKKTEEDIENELRGENSLFLSIPPSLLDLSRLFSLLKPVSSFHLFYLAFLLSFYIHIPSPKPSLFALANEHLTSS
jgi:splicing factor 3A subunit 1